MEKELLKLQKNIVPEALELMEKRYQILKSVENYAPIGRRSLSQVVGMTERVLRREVEALTKLELVKVEKKGLSLSLKGKEIIESLSPYMVKMNDMDELSRHLTEKYDIEKFYVLNGDADEKTEVLKELSRLTAVLLEEAFFDGAVISVTGGSTVAHISDYLKEYEGDLLFVPARGGLGEQLRNQANSISGMLALATGGTHKMLYAPDALSEMTFDSIQLEPAVKEVIDLNRRSHIVIHGVGEAFTMAKRRNSKPEDVQKLHDHDAVGEAFGYYFNRNGEVVHRINTVGIHLEDLKDKKRVFAVAGGSSKQEAILAYLNIAPKNTVFITDESVAKFLLEA